MKMKRTFTRMAAAVTAVFLFAAMILTGGSGTMTSASAENGTPVYHSSDLFTDRDLKQTADLDKAVTLTAEDGKEMVLRIRKRGGLVCFGKVEVEALDVDARRHLVVRVDLGEAQDALYHLYVLGKRLVLLRRGLENRHKLFV